jgi:uncharacterized protein YigA (DUF484 family)
MDAIALAQSLDISRHPDGSISLRELQVELTRQGLDEFAHAVEALIGRLSPVKLTLNNTIVPWF